MIPTDFLDSVSVSIIAIIALIFQNKQIKKLKREEELHKRVVKRFEREEEIHGMAVEKLSLEIDELRGKVKLEGSIMVQLSGEHIASSNVGKRAYEQVRMLKEWLEDEITRSESGKNNEEELDTNSDEHDFIIVYR